MDKNFDMSKYKIVNLFDKKDKKKSIKEIGIIIILISIIIIPNKLIKIIYESKYNLSSEKSFSTTPYLYMGMSEGEYANGWYNNQMGNTVYHILNDEEEQSNQISEQCTKDLKDRVKYLVTNPIYTLKFYSKKIITTWAEPTMEYGFYNTKYPDSIKVEEYFLANHLINGKMYEVSKIYQKAIIYIILIGSLITVLANRKELNSEILLLVLIFLGGFSFHILWETKSRYIIPYLFILIPVAVNGIEIVIQKIEDNGRKKNNKN